MAYLYISETGQSEGDLHLSDAANWNVSEATIKTIRVTTSATDWDLYILQNNNGYAANDAVIKMFQIVEAGNGDSVISLDHAYKDEDDSGEVHLYYLDNSGSNTADIDIIGVNTGTALSAGDIADAVLDELISEHTISGSLAQEVGAKHYPNR